MKAGIYVITNVVNSKVYVGKDKSIPTRKYQHWRNLKKKAHINKYLQKSWDRYGEKAFHYEILMYCPIEDLVYWEDWWMDFFDSLNPDKGYNLVSANRQEVSEETRAKMSASKMGHGVSEATRQKISASKTNPSDEIRARLSEAHKGKPNGWEGRKHTPEALEKISANNARRGKPSPNKGKIASEETRMKQSVSKKGKPWSEARRATYENKKLTLLVSKN